MEVLQNSTMRHTRDMHKDFDCLNLKIWNKLLISQFLIYLLIQIQHKKYKCMHAIFHLNIYHFIQLELCVVKVPNTCQSVFETVVL